MLSDATITLTAQLCTTAMLVLLYGRKLERNKFRLPLGATCSYLFVTKISLH
jgi:hypothetical protein